MPTPISSPPKTAAESLEGHTLSGGWVITGKLDKKEKESHPFFSQGYLVEHQIDKRKGFLKALDYEKVLRGKADPAFILNAMTAAYLFEKRILEGCRAGRMKRVV